MKASATRARPGGQRNRLGLLSTPGEGTDCYCLSNHRRCSCGLTNGVVDSKVLGNANSLGGGQEGGRE